MNVHEYQAKELMRKYDIAVLNGGVADTPAEAVEVAKKLGGDVWVVKAQIHAGGRGKGGGVKLARSIEEVEQHAKDILGMQLVTHQTGPEGKKVLKVLIEQGCAIEHEYYVGIVLDRAVGKPAFMVSTEGGMDIETVAHETPEKIIKAYIDPATGFTPAHGRKLGYALGLKGETLKKAMKFFEGLYKLYMEKDCSIAEINPLVTTKDGDVLALDAKLNFDDNALFRHPDI
ncbi:MAG: ATP-grasp domain-containing protein, partial [Candidatus Caldatribacteriota bacterium]